MAQPSQMSPHNGCTPERALRRAAKALAVDRITVEVVEAFDAAAIPYVLLKGPSIARWLYPTGGRTYGDTDLLVPTDEFIRAERALMAMGFVDALAGFSRHELGRSRLAETLYVRRAGLHGPGMVDLHRMLPGMPIAAPALWDAFSRDAGIIAVGGAVVKVPSRTAVALHVVVHAVQHGFGMHTAQDLQRAIETMSLDEWRSVVSLASELGISDVLGFGLRHASPTVSIADQLGLPTLPAERWPVSAQTPRGSASLLLLRSEPTLIGKLRRLRVGLAPSRAKVRYVSNLPDAHGFALAMAYVRWWLLISRRLGPAVRYVRSRSTPEATASDRLHT